jgi:beta-lactamase regulating signal transducer with metallopeptidase domain
MLNELIMYILKLVAISAVLWGYYALVLRDERFHQYNRFYLLGAFVVSTILPLIPWKFWQLKTDMPLTRYAFQELEKPQSALSFDYSILALIAIALVSIVLLAVMLRGILRLTALERNYPKERRDGIVFIATDLDNAPFSFWNRLFWRDNLDLQSQKGQKIFKHEITHIKQRHTLDRLYAQLMCGVFWMNPFFWKISKELETLHEFIADQSAVGDDSASELAELLLHTHFNPQLFNPTHSFHLSSIKRRIMMLTKPKNTKMAYLRQLASLPIVTVLIALFTIQLQAQEAPTPPKAPAVIVTEQSPTPPGAPTPPAAPAAQPAIRISLNAKDGKSETVVLRGVLSDTVDLRALKNQDRQALKELFNLSPDEISQIEIRKEVKDVLYVTKKGDEKNESQMFIVYADQIDSKRTKKKDPKMIVHRAVLVDSVNEVAPTLSETAVYYINGKRATSKMVQDLDPSQIKSVDVKKSANGEGGIYIVIK